MTTNAEHPRYHEIPVAADCLDCPQSGEPLKIVLFSQDVELRSHAVKHLLDSKEIDTVWRGLMSMEESVVTGCIVGLQRLGCPGVTLGISRPPCRGCRLYGPCTEIAAQVEAEYLRIVRTVLEEGGGIPRFACFFSDADGYDVFYLMPDRPAVVKASLVSEGCLNVMTCYGGAGVGFTQMRNDQMEMIQNQAGRKKNVVFCDAESWGLLPPEDESPVRPPGPKPKKPKRKRKPRHWRQYLDMLDEEYL